MYICIYIDISDHDASCRISTTPERDGWSFNQHEERHGHTSGSPYTSEVEARRNRPPTRLASPSMLIVPIVVNKEIDQGESQGH